MKPRSITDTTDKRSQFWDESVARSGHTGYSEALLHRYDQPIRLATVRHIIGKLFPGGLHGKTVLDIGCGAGDFVALSASLGAAVVDGIDISSQVLTKAEARFAGNERIRLLCGTVIDQVTQQERYDLITSITVLQHHVAEEELVAALVALRSALKPGGRMVVLELAPPLEEVNHQYSHGMLYLVERPSHVWHAAFDAAGFQVVNEPVMPQFGISCLRGISRVAGWLVSQRKSAECAPAQVREALPPSATDLAASPLSHSRQLRRKALAWVRAVTLIFCHPFDHWLKLPLPSARFRMYRIFVLDKR